MPQSIRPGYRSSLPTLLTSAMLSALFVFAMTAVSLPGTAFASVAKEAACSVNLRTTASTSAGIKATLKTGTKVTVATSVTGSAWKATCNGKTISSKFWYRISAVNGKSAKSLYGVTYVYGALYLFRPVTTTGYTRYAACSAYLRTSPSTTAASKGIIGTDTKVYVATPVTGAAWSATCAGRAVAGPYWYQISAINGQSVQSLYGVSYVYAANGLFKTAVTVARAPLEPTSDLTFDAECGGSGLDSRFRTLFGPGDPGDRLDTDTMGDLRQMSVANGMCTTSVERMTTPSGRPFAGAAMATYGTFSQKYGTFEARIRYDEAKGTWPSFFLLPVGQKGPYPEIDVFEAYGDAACLGTGAVTSAIHYAGETTSDYKVVSVANSSDWHVHRIVWTATKVEFSIDGVVKFSTSSHVPQVAMYPILVFGVGANNAACRADATTPSRLTMDTDYLRVYAP